jgi:hypothetical protein
VQGDVEHGGIKSTEGLFAKKGQEDFFFWLVVSILCQKTLGRGGMMRVRPVRVFVFYVSGISLTSTAKVIFYPGGGNKSFRVNIA